MRPTGPPTVCSGLSACHCYDKRFQFYLWDLHLHSSFNLSLNKTTYAEKPVTMVTCYNVQHGSLHSFVCPLCGNNPAKVKKLRKHTMQCEVKPLVNVALTMLGVR